MYEATYLDGDRAGSGTDESGDGTLSLLRTAAAAAAAAGRGRVGGLGAIDLLHAGDRVLDEVDALFERDRRIPARVADVAAKRHVRQQRRVAVYLVDRPKKYLDAMHPVLLPYLRIHVQRLLGPYYGAIAVLSCHALSLSLLSSLLS